MSVNRAKIFKTLAVLLAVLALGLALYAASTTARQAVFSIAATTDVVVVEPSCGDHLTWDLPPGWVVGHNAPLEDGAGSATPAMPVTVELAAGARATVSREAGGFWKMRFTGGSAFRRCTPAPPSEFIVTVGGKRLPTDPDGYTYQSAFGEDPAATATSIAGAARPLTGPAPPLALRLAGRIVLGQSMSEGGGWGTASQPLLHGARVEVRLKAPLTNQSLSVLVEEIGPGSIIDTHACIADEAKDADSTCAGERAGPSAGFVYYPTINDVMFAQVHRTTERVGVVPFGGEERALRVTKWAIWVKSPVLQSIVAALLLISALLQGLMTFRKAWSCGGKPHSADGQADSPPG